MLVLWLFFIAIIAISSAIYLASYGIWAAQQKNWLGAVGIWVVVLLTVTAPVGAFLIAFWYR